jgi:hypothetical protein
MRITLAQFSGDIGTNLLGLKKAVVWAANEKSDIN